MPEKDTSRFIATVQPSMPEIRFGPSQLVTAENLDQPHWAPTGGSGLDRLVVIPSGQDRSVVFRVRPYPGSYPYGTEPKVSVAIPNGDSGRCFYEGQTETSYRKFEQPSTDPTVHFLRITDNLVTTYYQATTTLDAIQNDPQHPAARLTLQQSTPLLSTVPSPNPNRDTSMSTINLQGDNRGLRFFFSSDPCCIFLHILSSIVSSHSN